MHDRATAVLGVGYGAAAGAECGHGGRGQSCRRSRVVGATPEVQPFMPQPPWQVRHARKLVAATVPVVIGLAYGAYRIWQFYIDPADRIAAAWRQGKEAPVPVVVPPAPVAVAAPVRPAPAVVPAPAPVLERQAEPIVPVSRRIPAVTHTRREPALPACAEQIVALGLCTPERQVRK